MEKTRVDSVPARCPSSPTNQRAMKKLKVADLYFFIELRKTIGEESSKKWLTDQMRPDVTKVTHTPSRTTSSSSTATQEYSSVRGSSDCRSVTLTLPEPSAAYTTKDMLIAGLVQRVFNLGKYVQAILSRFVLRFSKICRL
ncbi:hypothetical protein GUITHDRAFT_152786, partial [Guillardia theta CCMP2712]